MLYNKDQLTNYMVQGHVHLSKKDYGFFNNVKYIIQQNKPITSNQNKLFDKLLLKYQRQLLKLGYNYAELQTLDWKNPVISSMPEYLEAKVSIKDDTIIIQSPFNTQFIQHLRKHAYDSFTWAKSEKVYYANYSTYNFKFAINSVNKFYGSVKYCEITKKLLDGIESFSSCKIWEPTLVKIDNNFFIMAANPPLMDAISHLKVNDDPETLLSLSTYGVNIHETVLSNNLMRFASDFFTTCDLDKLDILADNLCKLNIKTVVLSRDLVYNKKISSEIKEVMQKYNIICFNSFDNTLDKVVVFSYNRLTDNYNRTNKQVVKFVTLTNSRPIAIK